MRTAPSFTARLAALVILLSATGCLTLHAALQAAEGQFELLAARKPIAEVIQSPRTPRRLRALLSEIPRIKRFGEANGLRPTASYQDYVQLRRPSAVYVVSACEPLRFRSKTWSFPIAGDFPYLGWFNLRSAQDYAKDLEDDGWDVDVRGAPAYSTLGWFHDPVLSSMIPQGPEALGALVDVVLHESVHATLHLEGQAPFNESLASFVAAALTPRYFAQTHGAGSTQLGAWRLAEERFAAAALELGTAREVLDKLYSSSLSDGEKRARKALVLDDLRARLHTRRRLTNATLAQHRTYSSGREGFARVLKACRGEVRCLLARVRTLTPKSFSTRHQENLEPVLLQLAQ